MKETVSGNKAIVWGTALIAVLFGLMTIKSGGAVLFGSEEARLAAGDYIPFVLWFNFSAGFLYVITGVAIALRKLCSVKAALFLVSSTMLVFADFGLHILINDVAYETRHVIAMTARRTVWAVISFLIYDQFTVQNRGGAAEK